MIPRWSTASIRARLTAWYAAVLAVTLIVYATATFFAVRHEFLEQLEDQPHDDVGVTADAEERVRGQLREILAVLVLGLPLGVALAGIGGYILARRALAPIDHSFERLRRFTADASHELRTPLAVIRGIGEGALAQSRTAAEYREAMGSMLEEVDRVTNLVDTLLRLSHADAGTVRLAREPLDLGELAREVVSSLAVLAEERNQRLLVDAPAPVIACGDRLVLREALTNIVDNAIKYSPRASTVDIGVRSAGNEAMVSVADEGPGIAAQHRDRIFDRFFRVDEARSRDRGGTGLGLAIAKWAVEINGGRIAVEPRPERGSLFRIVLPLASARVGSTQQAISQGVGG